MYPKELTDPIKKKMSEKNILNLETTDSVMNFIKDNKSSNSVVFINSVCGCGARIARPGFFKSLEHPQKPKSIGSVFAGVDSEATEKIRTYLAGYPNSSPAIAFFRQGDLVYLLGRDKIEGIELEILKDQIESVYNKFFGPDIRDDLEILDPFSTLEIKHKELKNIDSQTALLDCRDKNERNRMGFIENSLLLTEELAEEILKNWDREKKIITYSRTGKTGLKAALYFKKNGFKNTLSLEGGYQAYQSHENK